MGKAASFCFLTMLWLALIGAFGLVLYCNYLIAYLGKWGFVFLINLLLIPLIACLAFLAAHLFSLDDESFRSSIMCIICWVLLSFAFAWPICTTTDKRHVAKQLAMKTHCPVGWPQYKQNCYQEIEAKDWAEAQAQCESLQGNLASILSQEENDFIVNNVTTVEVWLGLQVNDASSWENVDGRVLGYQNFVGGLPTASTGECVTLGHLDGVWSPRPCDELAVGLCKRPINPKQVVANCWAQPTPPVRLGTWNDEVQFIKWADPDWMIDVDKVQQWSKGVQEGVEHIYMAAPIVLSPNSKLSGRCPSYSAVAVCYAARKKDATLDKVAAFKNCGWNFPGGVGFGRVIRKGRRYAAAGDSEERSGYESAAALVQLQAFPYKTLVTQWVTDKDPYYFADKVQSLATSIKTQFIAYGVVYIVVSLCVICCTFVIA
eukprot:NODE_729_length_1388_cov_229.029873_g552_i0.p1 GENE.NODE_729_length_1388_cov_229.029873_g552_i0~~NODE_729_length_1388_cov_229.029873_g552_i0.p1  ORF type:complete len:431 (-),score=71.08 NODE_729_length_1388_cov_229.029873_g552_i0:56-1348(-)